MSMNKYLSVLDILKKLGSSIPGIILSLFLMPMIVYAQSTPDVTPVVSGTPTVGTEYWVEIRVGSTVAVSDLYGLSLKLRSSSANTVYMDGSAERGTLLGSSVIEFFKKVNDQTVDIAITKTSTPGVNGSGLFARAKFRTQVAESVTFSLLDVSGYNAQGNTITFDPKSVTINVGSISQNPVPSLNSISPSTGERGNDYTVSLFGSNFMSQSSINVSGSGVSVSNITYVSSSELVATFSLSSSAELGDRSVTVTNPSPGGGASSAVSFTVTGTQNPVPALNSLSPNSGAIGSNQTVTLNGFNFIVGSTIAVSGSGVTVSAVSYQSPTQLTATFSVSSGATTGARSVTVTNPSPGGGTSSAVSFTVTAQPNPVPVVQSISPENGAPGRAVEVTITGANFVSGASLEAMAGITVSNLTFVNATQLTARFAIASAATLGARTLRVTNPSPGGGGSNTNVNFNVALPSPNPSTSWPTGTTVPTSSQPTFEWGAVSGAANYTIQVSTQNTFPQSVQGGNINANNFTFTYTITDTKYQMPLSLSVGNYFWRVRANTSSVTGVWSTPYSFLVVVAPSTPTLVTPANGATGLTGSVELVWTPTSNTTSYHVQVSEQVSFTTMFHEKTNVTNPPFALPAFASGNPIGFFWRVRSVGSGGSSEWSDVRYFTRAKLTADPGEDNHLPKTLTLLPNYPNPFNPTTQIPYQIPTAGEISLQLYAMDGRWLQTLKSGYLSAGIYTYMLDASKLSSGRYFVVLQQGNERRSIQISLVK